MDTFLLWYVIAFPKSKVLLEATQVKLLQGVKIEEIAGLSRDGFYSEMITIIKNVHFENPYLGTAPPIL